MTREDSEYLLEYIDGYEAQADDAFATLDSMADEMKETPGCMRLATTARKAAEAAQELCRVLSEKSEALNDRLDP
jgi:hypothetical protein